MVELPDLAVVPEQCSWDVTGGEATLTLKNRSEFPNQREYYGSASVIWRVDIDGETVATSDQAVSVPKGGTGTTTLSWNGTTDFNGMIARVALLYVYDGSKYVTPDYDLTGDDPVVPWLRPPQLAVDIECQTTADEVSPGDTFTVEASVDNTIPIDQTYPVRLEILSSVLYQKVTISGGSTEFVSFDISVSDNAQDGTTYNPSVSVPVVLDEDTPIETP